MRTVTALLLLAATAPAADPPNDARLAELVKLYQAYDLPVPPKDSKLYRCAPTGGKDTTVEVGFGIEPNKVGVPAKLLIGCETSWFRPNCTSEIRPDAKALSAEDISLTAIVQFELRGWHDLAAGMFADWVARNTEAPERAFARSAWHYWTDRLSDPHTDRATVARRLTAITRAEPRAPSRYQRVFLKHLLLALKPSTAMPGTVDAKIDELLDTQIGGGHISMAWHDPRYQSVVRLGFEAVPALIDHLGDNRLTRFRQRSAIGDVVGYCQVKHFASGILIQFMFDDEAAVKFDQEDVLKVADAKAWWAEASKVGEEVYAVDRVLNRSADASRPNAHLLLVIRHKYPKRLPEVFRTVLTDRLKMDLTPLAETVTGSSLSTETKRELLLAATEARSPVHRRVGRTHLRLVDPERFQQVMIGVLDNLPATASEPYRDCPEGQFAYEVLPTASDKVWAAAEKYLARADPGVRLEWLKKIHSAGRPSPEARRWVEFVAKFLTDESECDATAVTKMYPDGYATSPGFKSIQVRNYAACVLSDLLDLKTKPSPKWTADEWATFRAEVAKAAK